MVLDNLGSHKAKAVERRSEVRSAPRLLAEILARPQSDRAGLRQLKALLQKTAARTIDAISNAIAQVLTAFPPTECANYIENAGYAYQMQMALTASYSLLNGETIREPRVTRQADRFDLRVVGSCGDPPAPPGLVCPWGGLPQLRGAEPL